MTRHSTYIVSYRDISGQFTQPAHRELLVHSWEAVLGNIRNWDLAGPPNRYEISVEVCFDRVFAPTPGHFLTVWSGPAEEAISALPTSAYAAHQMAEESFDATQKMAEEPDR